MATPNLINVDTITPVCQIQAVTTSRASIVDVTAEYCAKINSLIIANIDGTNSADITVTLRNAAGGTTHSTIANTVAVPADATLIVVSKDTSIYLEEDMSLYVLASAAGDLSATCSYEEISE